MIWNQPDSVFELSAKLDYVSDRFMPLSAIVASLPHNTDYLVITGTEIDTWLRTQVAGTWHENIAAINGDTRDIRIARYFFQYEADYALFLLRWQ